VRGEHLTRFPVPDRTARPAAVLILFGEDLHGPDLLLLQRASTMRNHAGQPAFPGGAVDPDDDGPVGAALREAREETGLDPGGVEVLTTLPQLWLPASNFAVTPVLGWWREPSPVDVHDPGEVESVVRVSVAELTDPANRLRVSHVSGFIGPAFEVGGMLVWGFTAGLLDRLLEFGGWAMPWDQNRVEDLPDEAVRLAMRTGKPRTQDVTHGDVSVQE
jgi:8-oxo-dGTP pyrophosphatase MutT (NUDIX family)